MTNVFETVGSDIKKVAEEVGHIAVDVVEFPVKAEKVFSTIVKDYPQLKGELLNLAVEGKRVLVDGVAAAAAKGLDWPEDVAVIADMRALIADFKDKFLPSIEKAYGEIKTAAA